MKVRGLSPGSSDEEDRLNAVRRSLWRQADDVRDELRTGSSEQEPAVLEQYKLYVEMADRISARRGLANNLFLSLNATFFVGAIHAFSGDPYQGPTVLLTAGWLALCLECLGWRRLIRSYAQLNAAKYMVIGAMEERLPASPYWRAEWVALLGEGRDRRRYSRLSDAEQLVPVVFVVIYSVAYAGIVSNL